MTPHTSVTISYPAPRTHASSLLRSAGLRATPARIEVLVAFSTSSAPLGPKELVASLSERGVELIQIRRSLADLHKVGLLEPHGPAGQFILAATTPARQPVNP